MPATRAPFPSIYPPVQISACLFRKITLPEPRQPPRLPACGKNTSRTAGVGPSGEGGRGAGRSLDSFV